MEFAAIVLIALALAVDAFAVALAAGVTLCQITLRQTFRLAWHFGFFQSAMNILGWAAGSTVRPLIEAFAPWLAFALLAAVGIRMIVEALGPEEDRSKRADPTRGKTLIFLSVATSIDALAVGLGFSMLHIPIWLPALIIGIVATALTVVGLHLGCLLGAGSKLGTRAEIVGGLVLLAIGVKILLEHGVF